MENEKEELNDEHFMRLVESRQNEISINFSFLERNFKIKHVESQKNISLDQVPSQNINFYLQKLNQDEKVQKNFLISTLPKDENLNIKLFEEKINDKQTRLKNQCNLNFQNNPLLYKLNLKTQQLQLGSSLNQYRQYFKDNHNIYSNFTQFRLELNNSIIQISEKNLDSQYIEKQEEDNFEIIQEEIRDYSHEEQNFQQNQFDMQSLNLQSESQEEITNQIFTKSKSWDKNSKQFSLSIQDQIYSDNFDIWEMIGPQTLNLSILKRKIQFQQNKLRIKIYFKSINL